MKYKFELEIECESIADIIDLLEHVKNGVYGGNWSGGYDWACADYNWSIKKKGGRR